MTGGVKQYQNLWFLYELELSDPGPFSEFVMDIESSGNEVYLSTNARSITYSRKSFFRVSLKPISLRI